MVKDSNSDFLLYLRDYFRSRPAALREYDQLKVAQANAGAEDYWRAKDEFLAKILGDPPSPVRPTAIRCVVLSCWSPLR